MKIAALLLLLLLLIFSYQVQAAGVTAAAVFDVANVKPAIKAELFSDKELSVRKNGFSGNEEVYARIDVADDNGYDDIKSVKIKLIAVKNGTAVDLQGYEDFVNATFLRREGSIAVYSDSFLLGSDYDEYKLYVKASDENEETITSIDITKSTQTEITGAVVAEPRRELVVSFFKNIFSKILGWF